MLIFSAAHSVKHGCESSLQVVTEVIKFSMESCLSVWKQLEGLHNSHETLLVLTT